MSPTVNLNQSTGSTLSKSDKLCKSSQAGDADSSRVPGSGLQGVRECPSWCSIVGVTVHQFFCITPRGDPGGGVKSRMCPPYPHACRKRRLKWGAVIKPKSLIRR